MNRRGQWKERNFEKLDKRKQDNLKQVQGEEKKGLPKGDTS